MFSILKKTLFFLALMLGIFTPAYSGIFQTIWFAAKATNFLYNQRQTITGAGAGITATYALWEKWIKPGQEQEFLKIKEELNKLKEASEAMEATLREQNEQLESNNMALQGDPENPGLQQYAANLESEIKKTKENLKQVIEKEQQLQEQQKQLLIEASEINSFAERLNEEIETQNEQIVLFRSQVDGFDTQSKKQYSAQEERVLEIEKENVELTQRVQKLLGDVKESENSYKAVINANTLRNKALKSVVNNSVISDQVNSEVNNNLVNKLSETEKQVDELETSNNILMDGLINFAKVAEKKINETSLIANKRLKEEEKRIERAADSIKQLQIRAVKEK